MSSALAQCFADWSMSGLEALGSVENRPTSKIHNKPQSHGE